MEKEELKQANILAESAENDRRMQEDDRLKWENDLISQEIDYNMKKFGIYYDRKNDIKYQTERFFQNIFRKKLEFGGVRYDRMFIDLEHKDHLMKIKFEIILLNGDSIALINVKSNIQPDFVKELAEEHIKKFREAFFKYKNHIAYLGIAGFSFSDEVLEQASRYGIGIVKQVGEGIEISANNLKAY